MRGRADSFVVETNVHYPTDINLLFDAMRKVISLTAKFCHRRHLSKWRQSDYNTRLIKKLMRSAQNKKRSRSKNEQQKKRNEVATIKAHQLYVDLCRQYLKKARETLKNMNSASITDELLRKEIENFMVHADRQIDQIERRVIEGGIIPHEEKVFSIFEPHTEWIAKGKAGVPVELGLKVCIQEDQHQFILYHQVMQKQTDEQIAITMVEETQKRFQNFTQNSFDKGFHSPKNQEVLKEKLDFLVLPRKGRLSKQAITIESSEKFRQARRKHSAVESAINALEVHGLDRCPDRGIDRFKLYVALAIVARNTQRLGAILQMKKKKQETKRMNRCNHNRYHNKDGTLKLAA